VNTQGASTLTFSYGYDLAGRETTVTDAAGTFTRTYDVAGRVLSETSADGRAVTATYDTGGRRLTVGTPDGLGMVSAYDGAGRLSTVTPDTTMADAFNTISPLVDGSKWTTNLHSGGTATLAANKVTLASTATAGSSARLTSKAGVAADSDTTVSFQVTDPGTVNTGRFILSGRTQASGATAYRLDLKSDTTTARLVRRVANADTILATFAAPPAGTEIRAQLSVVGTQVRARMWPANTTAPAWQATVTDTGITGTGDIRLMWDRVAGAASGVNVDNLTQRNSPGTALTSFVTNTYNTNSQLTNEVLPSGSRAYTYTLGRVTKLVQVAPGADRTTDVTYDTSGAIATTAVGGVTTTYGYDQASQLLSSTPSTGSATTWTYDTAGRRTTTKIGTAAAETSTYNAASQLLTRTAPSGTVTTYAYDGAGRRTTETTGSTVTQLSYDPAGRNTTTAVTNGATAVSGETRSFDPMGTLRGVVQTGAAGAVLRTSRVDWEPDGGLVAQPVTVADTTGSTVAVRGVGRWAATSRAGISRALATDIYGSVLNSTSQTMANATGHDPYGIAVGATNTISNLRFGYRGELTVGDRTHLRARDYQPVTGMFHTVDPLDDVPATPTSGNRYHYTYNNPINSSDPTGMRPGDGAIDVQSFAGRDEPDVASTTTSADAACEGVDGQVVKWGRNGPKVCVEPPVSRVEGASCWPAVNPSGKAIVYHQGSCGVWDVQVKCARGGWIPGAEWVCRNGEVIKTTATMVAAVALGVAGGALIVTIGGAAGVAIPTGGGAVALAGGGSVSLSGTLVISPAAAGLITGTVAGTGAAVYESTSNPGSSGGPKSPKSFEQPTNPPRKPPVGDEVPSGYKVRVGQPTVDYPNGYWRLRNSGNQYVDPSTMKPPGYVSSAQFQARTHVPCPAGGC